MTELHISKVFNDRIFVLDTLSFMITFFIHINKNMLIYYNNKAVSTFVFPMYLMSTMLTLADSHTMQIYHMFCIFIHLAVLLF